MASKQNVTIGLTRETIGKAKVLAARRGTSISSLLAEQIERLVGEDEAYERAERQALALLDEGFHLGGVIRASREELYDDLMRRLRHVNAGGRFTRDEMNER